MEKRIIILPLMPMGSEITNDFSYICFHIIQEERWDENSPWRDSGTLASVWPPHCDNYAPIKEGQIGYEQQKKEIELDSNTIRLDIFKENKSEPHRYTIPKDINLRDTAARRIATAAGKNLAKKLGIDFYEI